MTRHPTSESSPVHDVPEREDAPLPELDPLLRRPLRDASPATTVTPNGVALGQVVSVSEEAIRVRLPDHSNAEFFARTLCPLPDDWQNRECAVLFENGDLGRPLIMGFLLTPQVAPPEIPQSLPQSIPDKELFINGERLILNADSELELRCGESVILLQRDGRIEIRGNYITSQATATQRLRGGSIHMN